jgi:hypothetical protein
MLRNPRSSSSELNATRRVALPVLPCFVVVTAAAEAEARKETRRRMGRRKKGTKQAMIGRRRPKPKPKPKQKEEAIRGWWISFGGACRVPPVLDFVLGTGGSEAGVAASDPDDAAAAAACGSSRAVCSACAHTAVLVWLLCCSSLPCFFTT